MNSKIAWAKPKPVHSIVPAMKATANTKAASPTTKVGYGSRQPSHTKSQERSEQEPAEGGGRLRCKSTPGDGSHDPASAREVARPHEELVDRAGRLPSLPDRPHDERLAPPHVPGGEDLVHRRAVALRVEI